MHYDHFSEIIKSELPINRKERFYTGTVLPAILFHNGLSNFYAFLNFMDGFPKEINEKTTGDSFLFYTEYNLKESAGERSAGQLILTGANDTPDIVIEILKPKRIFIIMEGKMFAAINQEDIAEQISRQKEYIAEPLLKKFNLLPNDIFHIALLPKALGISNSPNFQVMNWEIFFDDKKFYCQNNLFFNYLKSDVPGQKTYNNLN
jgi:hypothetical protein